MSCKTRIWSIAAITTTLITGASSAATIGFIKLEGEYPERHTAPVFLQLSGKGDATFRELVDSLYVAADRPKPLDGLMLRATDLALSTTQIEELGRAIEAVRAAGTRVHFFTEIYGPAEIVLASFADEAIIQSGGAVTFPGIYLEEMFLADALGSIGIEPDFVQIGDYKGASEPIANSEPSPQWSENINQLLDGLYANLRAHVGEHRRLSEEQLDEAMSACVLADAPTAIEAGLIDAAVDRRDLDAHLQEEYGERIRWDPRVGPRARRSADYSSMSIFEAFSQLMLMLEDKPQGTQRETIAVVHIDGQIVDGESTPAGLLAGPAVGSLTIRKVLGDLEDDPNVKGVLVRINSPGGSAIASESIWLGLERLAESRPVWVSVGAMAASGGYYIAVAGDRIYVNPSSIVGSIGVVGGKLALAGLYDKLHINVVPRSRGPRAGMMSMLSPWSESERLLVRDRMTSTYDLFVRRVRNGRRGIDISRTAEGRLFTGDRAVALEMADQVGGLDQAIHDLASELEMEEGEYDILDYPPPPTLDELLEQVLPSLSTASVGAAAPLGALRELLGPIAFDQLRAQLGAIMQLHREPVILISPRVILMR